MSFFKHLKIILRHPSILLQPRKRIILLSHMRANTSVFGHVLGSNPEIEGYYELHIGYYSWKSFFRQKLIYFAEHSPKRSAKYMFDKVLHNEHKVNVDIFNDDDIFIIMVREPIATISSIQKLFAKVDPQHPYNEYEYAEQYYLSRLEHLIGFSQKLKGRFYFINATSLTQSPDRVLDALTKVFKLSIPLSKKYQIFKKTGSEGAGDSSQNMQLGEIKPKLEAIGETNSETGKPIQNTFNESVKLIEKLAKEKVG